MKTVVYFLCFLGHFCCAQGNPDLLYENFTKGYAALDPGLVAAQYVAEAELFNLYDGALPTSVKGKTEIHQFFADFFRERKQENQTLNLVFKVVARRKVGDLIFDNGYYKLIIAAPGASPFTSYGKFSTILQWDGTTWKFKADANTNTTAEEYDSGGK
jgi:ketosteroid isomerase-like protein